MSFLFTRKAKASLEKSPKNTLVWTTTSRSHKTCYQFRTQVTTSLSMASETKLSTFPNSLATTRSSKTTIFCIIAYPTRTLKTCLAIRGNGLNRCSIFDRRKVAMDSTLTTTWMTNLNKISSGRIC